MKAKYTPGPWTLNSDTRDMYAEIVKAGRDRAIADIASEVGAPYGPEERANAALISAAPDLLEALESLLPFAQDGGPEFGAACAALAKARGES